MTGTVDRLIDTDTPLVTFIVPCYKLAHFLVECVDSILAQSCPDFELLIMDDCSPDDTPGVAAGITDRRVRYVRNEVNVGHLRNYNIGIGLARGKYIWLISADDRLRSDQVLQRYVDVLEHDDAVAFAYCTGMTMTSTGVEGSVTGQTYRSDRLVSSDEFVSRAVRENPVCTPGALARRQHYLDNGLFPLDLPFAGDWLCWCAFGLRGKVAFFAEAMVNYRLHDGSNTALYRRDTATAIIHDEIEVRWRVWRMAAATARPQVAAACRDTIAFDYANRLQLGRARSSFGMSLAQFDESTASPSRRGHDVASIRSRVFASLADDSQDRGDLLEARRLYTLAQREEPRWDTRLKRLLSHCGGPGLLVRNAIYDWKTKVASRRGKADDRSAAPPVGNPGPGVPSHGRVPTPNGRRPPPLVSVIIPCYNSAHFLQAAIDSALRQTYSPVEVIVVNDGSTDNFPDVISPYRSRVKVIDQSNVGLSAARNRGLDHSSGEMIAYLDADDQWQPTKLEQQVQLLLERPEVVFVHTGVQFTDERGVPLSPAPPVRPMAEGCCLAALARWNSVIVSSVLHTRRALGPDRFDPHLTVGDWDLWLRLAAKGPVAYIDEQLTLYRYHANNMSKGRRVLVMDGLKLVAGALKRHADPAVRRALFETRRERYSQLAHLEYEADNLNASSLLFWGSLPRLGMLGAFRLPASSVGLSRTRVTNLLHRAGGSGSSSRWHQP